MGKCKVVERILPIKQRYEHALFRLIRAIIIIQRWFRKFSKHYRARKGIQRLNRFIQGHHFDECRQLFYADHFRIDMKRQEEEEKKEKKH